MSLILDGPVSVDDPRREIRAGLLVLGLFGALFAAWAASAPLDAAATATGQISVSGHDQAVQHPDGGVVAAVDVVEGQAVHAGQPLIELAPEALVANVNAMRSQVVSLQAQQARLAAEAQGAASIVWPSALLSATGADADAARVAMRQQQKIFETGLSLLRAEQSMNRHKAEGVQEQIGGLQSQVQSNERQRALLQQQLRGVQTLAEKGFASQNSVRLLERSDADLVGAHAQYNAAINASRQEVATAQIDSERLGHERSAAAASALRDTQDQLNVLLPKLQAAQVQLDRGTLRAQTDGVVTGLNVYRPGTVVAAGQKLMEVVPSHSALVVDARIAASDIQGIHAGQPCEIRVAGLNGRPSPIISGSVTRISADSFTDDRSGAGFYTAKIVVSKQELTKLDKDSDAKAAIRPGVPVQVMIPLQKRTAFEYLFEPLSQTLWQAFRQR